MDTGLLEPPATGEGDLRLEPAHHQAAGGIHRDLPGLHFPERLEQPQQRQEAVGLAGVGCGGEEQSSGSGSSSGWMSCRSSSNSGAT